MKIIGPYAVPPGRRKWAFPPPKGSPFEKGQPAAAQRNNGSRFPAAGAALPQSRLFYACAPAASRAASMAHSASMTRASLVSMSTCGAQP